MADLDPSRRTPLHPGVDAQSWLGFEQRIQARRFEALVASAREAIANGNAVLAEHAIDEAREIRPDAPDLPPLVAAVRMLRPRSQGVLLWRRAAGALMLLAVGVSMFLALDQTRLLPGAIRLITPPPPRLLTAVPTVRNLDVAPALAAATEADSAVTAAGEIAPASSQTRPSIERTASATERTNRASERGTPASRVGATAAEVELPAPDAPPIDHDKESDAINRIEPVARIESTGAAFRVAMPSLPSVPNPTPAIVAAVVDRTAEEESRVADVLRRYARAYDALDVRAAREVWPNVDQRALARAFDGLESQTVSFDACQIDVRGATANASCSGQASYVGKVGRGAPRTEPRTWRFELRREGETWKIASAEARRTSG